MAFSAYKYRTDVEALGISVAFENFISREDIVKVPPTDWLITSLAKGSQFGKASEKARSELVIAPVILEIVTKNRDYFSLVSGVNLEVKRGENGKSLKGAVDFLICQGKDFFEINSPILSLVESKKSELELGYWQCAAEMVAAQQFNKEKGNPKDLIWGCVTIGFDWQFLKLADNQLTIENNIYTLNDLPQLLGAWQWILDQCK